MTSDLASAEARIDSDKRKRERETEAILLLLLLQARRYAVHAVRLGSNPYAAMAGVMMGSQQMDLPGGTNRLAAILLAAEYDGYQRSVTLMAGAPYLYDSRANYTSIAAQTLAQLLASVNRHAGAALATAGSVASKVGAIRRAFTEGRFVEENGATPWRLSSVSGQLVARAYNTGYRTGILRPDLPEMMLRYVAVIDRLTTIYCRKYDGTTLPLSHPWWSTHWPPTHGPPETGPCRAVVVPVGVSAKTVEPPDSPAPQYGFGLFPLGLLRKVNKTIIIGGPNTGKTTLAKAMAGQPGVAARHTDDLIPMGWSESSEAAAAWIDEPGDGVIEGVAAVRALRKWLKANPGKPLPANIILLRHEFETSTPGQAAMAKGVWKVWDEIATEVRRRGARITRTSGADLSLLFAALLASEENRRRKPVVAH